MLSIAEIINSVQQGKAGALLIFNKYVLGFIWEDDSGVYLINFYSKDEREYLSSCGTSVFLKLDSLYSLKNYI